jgi:hypothetical protein
MLDPHAGETFMPVMLSSMHVSSTSWSAETAYVDSTPLVLPVSGWVTTPPIVGKTFGLVGGSSDWNSNSPTVQIVLDQPRQVTGRVKASNDKNDDNVAFWAASDDLLEFWEYSVSAAPAEIAATPTASPTLTLPTSTVEPTNTPVPPTPTPTPLAVAGDADCSGTVNSIDASVVLQFAAALLGSVDCDASADVNHDGVVSSIDAALILQIEAGLIESLSLVE